MFTRNISVVMATLALPLIANAAQFQATPSIFNGTSYAASYTGTGGTTALYNQPLGEVVGGGNNAFDAFGFYNSGVGSLTQTRQVELLSGNVFRFFDTFTNKGSASVTTTLNFFGNLGSDGSELVSFNQGGLMVSCTDDGSGACTDQPVLALVSGNNGLGKAAITPDRYNVQFTVNLAPGQSLSLLNYAYLAMDENGPTPADQSLAEAQGQLLRDTPRLDGLSEQQIASIANFTISPVPEPSSWGLAMVALLLLGQRLRSRGRAPSQI